MQQSRSKRARRNSSPRMIKVTVHERRRVNEEQPTPASSPSRNHDSAAPRQHSLICTGAEPIHQVHGPPKPRATESMLRNRIQISAIFPPKREFARGQPDYHKFQGNHILRGHSGKFFGTNRQRNREIASGCTVEVRIPRAWK